MKTVTLRNGGQIENPAPGKIVCVGRNYVEHIEELQNEIPSSIVLFNKPNSAISEELRYFNEHTRFEGEICFLIRGAQFHAIGFGLDLTKADIQNTLKQKGLPWEKAKAFDGSAIFSEFVEIPKDNLAAFMENLRMELTINNEPAQCADYSLMMYKPITILNEIQSFMSLEDNDIIMTGTPKGVGPYSRNDKFHATIKSGETLVVEKKWIVK